MMMTLEVVPSPVMSSCEEKGLQIKVNSTHVHIITLGTQLHFTRMQSHSLRAKPRNVVTHLCRGHPSDERGCGVLDLL